MPGRIRLGFGAIPPFHIHALIKNMQFQLSATDGLARRGQLTFLRGTVETPAFMPVAAYGTVKAMTPEELRETRRPPFSVALGFGVRGYVTAFCFKIWTWAAGVRPPSDDLFLERTVVVLSRRVATLPDRRRNAGGYCRGRMQRY